MRSSSYVSQNWNAADKVFRISLSVQYRDYQALTYFYMVGNDNLDLEILRTLFYNFLYGNFCFQIF